MGRRSKISEQITADLVTAFSLGATHRVACQYAGIAPDTLYEWLDRGARGEKLFIEFAERINLANGRAAVGWLAKIEKAANDGTWQAAAWKLERRYPQEYGRTVQEHHIKLDWERLSESQLRRLAAGEPPEQVLTDTPGDPQG